MAWKKVGEVDLTITQDGTTQETRTVNDTATVEIFNHITDHGSGTINGPNDTLSGSGYYSSISNDITDRGSLDNVTPGSSEPSGYYSSGTIPESSYSTTVQVNGSNQGTWTQSSDSTYDVSVSGSVEGMSTSWNPTITAPYGEPASTSGIGAVNLSDYRYRFYGSMDYYSDNGDGDAEISAGSTSSGQLYTSSYTKTYSFDWTISKGEGGVTVSASNWGNDGTETTADVSSTIELIDGPVPLGGYVSISINGVSKS